MLGYARIKKEQILINKKASVETGSLNQNKRYEKN